MFTKSKIVSILLFIVLASTSLLGQSVKPMEFVEMNKVKDHLNQLCSEEMYGRGYVRNGHVKAANYISGKFKEYGLRDPNEYFNIKSNGASDPEYLQPFIFSINTFPGVVSLKIDKEELELGQDYIMTPFSGSGKGKAKPLYIDSSNVYNVVKRNEWMRSNLKRKVVVYSDKEHDALMNMDDNALDYIEKLYSARALIKINDTKLTAGLSTKQYAPPVFEILKDSLPKKFRKIKFEVEAIEKKQVSQNVFGYIEGSEEPDSFIVFTAHYDHLGGMGSIYFPGANDNAAGIAMLLELARFYAQPENKPKHSILFIGFSAEEAGLIGSAFYTQHPLFGLNNIKFLLNLDLVGTGSKGATVVNGTLYRSDYDRLVEMNEKGGYLPVIKIRGEAANSDHYYFSKAGVPSFFLYLMGGPPAYHDVYDIPETLPLTKFKELFELMIEFERSF